MADANVRKKSRRRSESSASESSEGSSSEMEKSSIESNSSSSSSSSMIENTKEKRRKNNKDLKRKETEKRKVIDEKNYSKDRNKQQKAVFKVKESSVNRVDEKHDKKRRRKDYTSLDEDSYPIKSREKIEMRGELSSNKQKSHEKGRQYKSKRDKDMNDSYEKSVMYNERYKHEKYDRHHKSQRDDIKRHEREKESVKKNVSPKDYHRLERTGGRLQDDDDGDHHHHHHHHHDSNDYKGRDHRNERHSDDERSQKKRDNNERRRKEGTEKRREKHIREWDRGKSRDDNNEWKREHRERNNEYDDNESKETDEQKKEEPNFELSGKLTEFTNTYKGVVIKYNEPPEARKPKTKWRLYPFKGDESLPILYIHRQSAFLLGRNRMIADIPVDHPSCSSQHAVIQFRFVDYAKPDGSTGKRVKPYIIDLESSNGTFVNNNKIEPRRYVELKEKDVIKFGFSSREYVILHDQSKGEFPDDE